MLYTFVPCLGRRDGCERYLDIYELLDHKLVGSDVQARLLWLWACL